MPAPTPDEQAMLLRAHTQPGADFKIITASMELGSWRGAPVVNMVGSSTIRDRKKDVMLESALVDMTKVEPGMVIWLNHDYKLPDSLFGSLIKSPVIKYTDSYADLHITSDVETGNTAAARTYAYIEKGRKIGCSIGARVDEAHIDEELFEKSGEIAIIIEHVTPVEWSVVGVPCNQRSWVENAIKGYGLRTLQTAPHTADERLMRLTKSLWPRPYSEAVKALHSGGILAADEATRLWDLEPLATPAERIVWDPPTGLFKLFGGTQGEHPIEDRSTLASLLGLESGHFAQDLLSHFADSADSADSADNFLPASDPDDQDLQDLVAAPADLLAAEEHPEGERNAPLPVLFPADDPLTGSAPWRDASPEGEAVLLNGIDFAHLSVVVAAAARSAGAPLISDTHVLKMAAGAPSLAPAASAPAPQQETPKVKTKTKAVWAVAWKAYPTFKAQGDAVSDTEFSVVWMPLSITKDGVERLTPDAIAANTAEVTAKLAELSEAQTTAFDAFLKAEEYPAHEARATDAFHAQRKAEKATRKAEAKAEKAAAREQKLAAAVGLLTKGEERGAEAAAATDPAGASVDPARAAKFSYLTTLATELGVEVKAKGLLLPEAEPAALRRKAAMTLLREAHRIIKSGAAISEKNMAQLQLAHDALALVTEGVICTVAKGATVDAGNGTPARQLTNGAEGADLLTKSIEVVVDTSAITASLDALKSAASNESATLAEQLTAARAEVATLQTRIETLKAMPLGRPTLHATRIITDPAAVTWGDMAAAATDAEIQKGASPLTAAAPAEDDVLSGTHVHLIKRGGFDMRMRHWPAGYAVDRRPPLTTRVMPYMLVQDIQNYKSGAHGADVPELD